MMEDGDDGGRVRAYAARVHAVHICDIKRVCIQYTPCAPFLTQHSSHSPCTPPPPPPPPSPLPTTKPPPPPPTHRRAASACQHILNKSPYSTGHVSGSFSRSPHTTTRSNNCPGLTDAHGCLPVSISHNKHPKEYTSAAREMRPS